MNIMDKIEARARDAAIIVVDVETTGLDWRKDRICGYVLSFGPNPEDSFYLPVRHESGPNLAPDRVASFMRHIASTPRHWVGHNLQFDLMFLLAEGVALTGTFEDTAINDVLIYEHHQSYSLASCAERHGVAAKKGSELYTHIADKMGVKNDRNTMGHFWRLPANDALAVEYAVGDGVTTWQLWASQTKSIVEMGLNEVWDLECRTIPALVAMQWRGVAVNEQRLHSLREWLDKERARLQDEIGSDLNMRSAKQLKEYFTEKGLTNFPQTDKGNASFTESWLSTNEPGRRIVEFRKTSNLLNSFVMPLIDEHVHKGRVHTTYHQMRGDEFGTVTGRLSSTHPNLQQVPKRNYALGIPLRSVFVPDSGRRWLSVDWSQAEPRLLAYYGNVATLINGYKADPPLDAHSSVANAAGIDRQSGKRLNQGLITGMGTKKAMAELVAAGKSVSEAQDILDKYFAAMPELKSLQRRAADVMKKRGYVISLMGRRSNLEQPGLEYKAVNRLLQCSNADMIKYSMVRIHEEFGSDPDVEMLVNIHDSLDFQVAPGAEAKAQRCLDIMRDVPKVKEMLPVEVDSDWGDNWAQASYSKKDYDNRMKEVFGG